MANILICDDDVDIVSALKIYLSNEDYKIYTAFTGKQALDCVKEHDIDLVLMDVMMPEMDGIAATAKLREEYNIPVILPAQALYAPRRAGEARAAEGYHHHRRRRAQ